MDPPCLRGCSDAFPSCASRLAPPARHEGRRAMEHPATAISRDLAGQAERLCRRYLSHGRREGNYWLVGDVRNTPGRSLYVRLRESADGSGRAGKWTDAESGE